MLKFDTTSCSLHNLSSTNLVKESLLERYDLQAAIVASWEEFCDELKMGHLYYIGNEINPHASCGDSIDILALDWEGAPVVIELKRSRDKLQLLQALSYAAMMKTWTPEDFLQRLAGKECESDVRSLLENIEEMPDPRIVLVAEDYDPEVILTADFLHNRDIDVTAVALQFVKHGNDLLMSINRRYPLPGLEETYTARGHAARKQNQSKKTEESSTWEDVLAAGKLPVWAPDVINELKKRGFGDGNPKTRFFGAKRGTSIGNILMICMRSDNAHVHVYDQSYEHGEALRAKFGQDVTLEPWGRAGEQRSGWSFRLRTITEVRRFFDVLDGRV